MKTQTGLLIAVALLAGASTNAAESMRCKNRLVKDGDPQAKVAELCGEPTQVETRSIVRSGYPRRDLNRAIGDPVSVSDRELLIHDRSHVEVQVDVWLYNFGKRRLMREVVFLDNRVVEVNVLGRGY